MASNKKLIENITSLLLFQGINYLFPLITFPYLVRVLGAENFGLYVFVFAFIQYFIVFVDYGFNLTATREVSINRNDEAYLSKVFNTVFTIKLVLMLITIVILCVFLMVSSIFYNNWPIYLVAFIAVFGNFIYPVWFFQGIEKMKTLVVINTISKIVFTAAIFIFVKSSVDTFWAVFLQATSIAFAGIVGCMFVIYSYKIKVTLPPGKMIINQLKHGFPVFVSIFSSTLFANSNVFILGLLTNNFMVGYYAIAEKVVRVFVNLSAPIGTAIFPHVSNLFKESSEKAVKFLRNAAIYGGFIFLLISIIVFLNADILVKIISGNQSLYISRLIKIMSFLPFTIYLDNLYGTQVLLNINKNKLFMVGIVVPGIASLVLSLIFVPLNGALASAYIVMVAEVLVLVLMVYFTVKSRIYLIKENII